MKQYKFLKHRLFTNNKIRLLKFFTIAVILSSCASVVYDMRKLEHPVTMSGNPFVGDIQSRPQLNEIDTFFSTASTASSAVSMGYGSTMVTSSSSAIYNSVQADAFKKVGGDSTKVITKVYLNADTHFFNFLFGLGAKKKIEAHGKIQSINK